MTDSIARLLRQVASLLVLISLIAAVVTMEGTSASAAAPGGPDTVGLVDPDQGKWYLRSQGGQVTSFFYGNPGDIPFIGDWDCDGDDTPGLFRQSDAFAYLRNSNSVGIADIRFFFGNPSDVPLAGDWNGDGCDTLSIYRPSEQRFYIVNKLGENEGGLGAADFFFTFGNPGDKPVVGDWDGDGIDEVGLHRESTGFFYWRNTLDTGIATGDMFFGDPGDRFVAGDWGTVDSADTPAVFRPANTTFFFRHTLTQGVADSQFAFGEAGWLPVAGEFGPPPNTSIKFWSTETQPHRLAITQGIIDRFTSATGIAVELTATDESQLPGLMITNAASGTLPDVVYHPIDFTIGWATDGLLNTEAANQVVQNLDPSTFSQGALQLATVGAKVAAVPSDGWGQLLIFRKDLFDAAGLAVPDTFAKIETAAAALNDPANDFYGITASNDAGAVFTQQTFEHFALANGCRLVGATGTPTLDSDNCVEAIDFYTGLLTDYAPPGLNDVVSTRATYFAGDAAMIVWSPFILDEMAGLRDSALPTCPECAGDIAYLAKNSGLVPSFSGPSGAPAQYGQISYMGIGNTGDADRTAAAQAFVEFWLSDGYLNWLSTSVEGNLPMRQGTTANPTEYVDAWKTLETGVDRKAALDEFYPGDVLDTLIQGSDNFDRWGFVQGQGELVTAMYTALHVPEAIRDVLDGTLTPQEAAADIQQDAEDELKKL